MNQTLKFTYLFSLSFIVTSCFQGTVVENNERKIVPDFWLNSTVTESNNNITWSKEDKLTGGVVIIDEKIIEIGNNDEFIIAKQVQGIDNIR